MDIDRINASDGHIAVSVLSYTCAIDLLQDVLHYIIMEYARLNGEREGVRLFVVFFALYPCCALETVERIEETEIADKVKFIGRVRDDEIVVLHGDIPPSDR